MKIIVGLITVRADADFADLLSTFAVHRVHHVFVTNLDGAPMRMLTPSDVLSAVALPGMVAPVGWRCVFAYIHRERGSLFFVHHPIPVILCDRFQAASAGVTDDANDKDDAMVSTFTSCA